MEQPNFNLASECCRIIAGEIAKCNPAYTQNQAMMGTLTEILRTTTTQNQAMMGTLTEILRTTTESSRRTTEVLERTDRVLQLSADTLAVVVNLEKGVAADRTNSVARLQNAFLLRPRPQDQLAPFKSLDNEVIDRSPATYGQFQELSVESLDFVLTKLGLDDTGDQAAKRGRLGIYIGLNPAFCGA